MQDKIYGVGYVSEGKYSLTHDKLAGTYWRNMIKRCYCEKALIESPTYVGCTVCEEWLDFINFASWYYENYYKIDGEVMCLDKDILVKGNKIYSPSTCVFVPKKINSLFVKCDKVRGELPIGVREYIPGRYECKVRIEKRICKCFDSPIEAFNWYKKEKESYIKRVANNYKNLIPQKLYNAMMNYEVNIND